MKFLRTGVVFRVEISVSEISVPGLSSSFSLRSWVGPLA